MQRTKGNGLGKPVPTVPSFHFSVSTSPYTLSTWRPLTKIFKATSTLTLARSIYRHTRPLKIAHTNNVNRGSIINIGLHQSTVPTPQTMANNRTIFRLLLGDALMQFCTGHCSNKDEWRQVVVIFKWIYTIYHLQLNILILALKAVL